LRKDRVQLHWNLTSRSPKISTHTSRSFRPHPQWPAGASFCTGYHHLRGIRAVYTRSGCRVQVFLAEAQNDWTPADKCKILHAARAKSTSQSQSSYAWDVLAKTLKAGHPCRRPRDVQSQERLQLRVFGWEIVQDASFKITTILLVANLCQVGPARSAAPRTWISVACLWNKKLWQV
jgi:hypothetical protein